MRKLKVVWASPLRPQHSGIAAYSEDLLQRLAGELELTVLHDGFSPATDFSAFPARLMSVAEFPAYYARHPQDVVVYHMGNNAEYHEWIWSLMQRWRGLTLIHDSCFHHFLVDHYRRLYRPEAYLADLLRYHGVTGYEFGRKMLRAIDDPGAWELRSAMHEYSLLGKIMDQSVRVAAHNAYALHEAERASARPVDVIPMNFVPAAGYLERGSVNGQRYGASPGVPLILSLGYVTAQKRLDRVLTALGRLAREGVDFRLVVAGQAACDLPSPLEQLAREAGIGDRVRILGHVPDSEMYRLLAAADLAVNLRYPTAGESSAALIRLMGAGVPTLVTDHGAMSEFPDDVVRKVSHDEQEIPDLMDALRRLLARGDERQSLGERARAYILREHHIDRVATRYLEVIEATRRDLARPMFDRAAHAAQSALTPLRGLAAYERIDSLTAASRAAEHPAAGDAGVPDRPPDSNDSGG